MEIICNIPKIDSPPDLAVPCPSKATIHMLRRSKMLGATPLGKAQRTEKRPKLSWMCLVQCQEIHHTKKQDGVETSPTKTLLASWKYMKISSKESKSAVGMCLHWLALPFCWNFLFCRRLLIFQQQKNPLLKRKVPFCCPYAIPNVSGVPGQMMSKDAKVSKGSSWKTIQSFRCPKVKLPEMYKL